MNKKEIFYIRGRDGGITGPFPLLRMQAMLDSGRIADGDSISRDGVSWEKVSLGDKTRENAPQKAEPLNERHAQPENSVPSLPPDTGTASPPGTCPFGFCPTSPSSGNPSSGQEVLDDEFGADGNRTIAFMATWGMIFCFCWEGTYFWERMGRRVWRAAGWILPYGLLACSLPWLLWADDAPSRLELGYGVLEGLLAWTCIFVSSLLAPVLVSWFDVRRFYFSRASCLASLHIGCVFSVFYGTAMLFRKALASSGACFWSSVSLLGAVGLWCLWSQWRMLRHYSLESLRVRSFSWVGASLATSFLFVWIVCHSIKAYGGFS